MKHIIKKLFSKYLKNYEENNVFYPMNFHPPKNKEAGGLFSVLVLVFEDNHFNTASFGYFDYDKKNWKTFEESSQSLKCWCYIPSPNGYPEVTTYESIISS